MQETVNGKRVIPSSGFTSGAQDEIQREVEQALARAQGVGPLSQYLATTTTKNASVTIHALDAIGGAIRNVVVEFFLDDDAAATFTPAIYKTSMADPTTFVIENIPSISTIATPAADGRYRYDCGDVPEGLQMEVRVAQDNAGDATNAIRSVLTHD